MTSVAIFTGGGDSHYAIPLSLALAARSISVEVIGSDEFTAGAFKNARNVIVHNFHGDTTAAAGLLAKGRRTVTAYARMVRYAMHTDIRIFHFLWLSRFPAVDTLVLLPFFRAIGKTLLFTAHNVDTGERDGESTTLSRWRLRRMYRLMDHVFVHTRKMKQQLVDQFAVDPEKITVIPFGLNTVVPESHLTTQDARKRLGIAATAQVVLFFGNITPYKGIEHLLQALALIEGRGVIRPTVLIAGRVKGRHGQPYHRELVTLIERLGLGSRLIHHVEFIPDDDVETYFKASDVCVLPYTTIFQSGVLFLAYRFGLPVIASDAGSMREDVVEGRTGFVFAAGDSRDLADTIERYFASDMFRNMPETVKNIRKLANEKYSWERIAGIIHSVYGRVSMVTAGQRSKAADPTGPAMR